MNGRSTIIIPTNTILDSAKTYSESNNLEIRANFTETLTGVTRNATTILIPIKNQQYKLSLISTNSDTFLPGFPFTFRATVLDLNNQPLPPSARNLTLTISYYDKRGSWGKQIPAEDLPNNQTTVSTTDTPLPEPTTDEDGEEFEVSFSQIILELQISYFLTRYF